MCLRIATMFWRLSFGSDVYTFALLLVSISNVLVFTALEDLGGKEIPCRVLWKIIEEEEAEDVVLFSNQHLSPNPCVLRNSLPFQSPANPFIGNIAIAYQNCASLSSYSFVRSKLTENSFAPNQTDSNYFPSQHKRVLLLVFCNHTEMEVLAFQKVKDALPNYKLTIFFSGFYSAHQFALQHISSFSVASQVLCVFVHPNGSTDIHELYTLGHGKNMRIQMPKVLTLVSDVVSVGPLRTSSPLFSERSRSDLLLTDLRVSGVISKEYSYDTNIIQNAEGSYLFQDSFAVQVLFALQYTMNFKIEPRVTTTWGHLDDNNSWTGMISLLLRNEADIGISSLADRPFRREVVDFNMPTNELHLSAFFRRPSKVSQSNALLAPFQKGFWIAVFLWCICASLAFTLFKTVLMKYEVPERILWGTTDCFQCSLGSLCLQGQSNIPSFYSFRILFATGSLAAVVIFSAYAGTLFSFLSVSLDSIKDLEQLLKTYYQISIINSPLPIQFISESPLASIQEIARRRKIEPKYSTMGDASTEIAKGSFIFICDHLSGYSSLNSDFSFKDACKIKEITVPNGAQRQGTIVQKGSQYKRIIDYQLLRMREYGLVKYWNKRYINSKPICWEGSKFERVRLETVMLAFFILIFGFSTSAILFLSEYIFTIKNIHKPFIYKIRRTKKIPWL